MPADHGSSITDRARSGVNVDPQDGLFDRVIEDGDLIADLEDRYEKNQARLDAIADFKQADEKVKNRLTAYHLEVGEVARIGRFKIKRTRTAPADVAFERGASDQTRISLLPQD